MTTLNSTVRRPRRSSPPRSCAGPSASTRSPAAPAGSSSPPARGRFAWLLGLPPGQMRGAGLALLPFAALLGWLGTRATLPRAALWAVVAVNALWVVESVVLLLSGSVSPTGSARPSCWRRRRSWPCSPNSRCWACAARPGSRSRPARLRRAGPPSPPARRSSPRSSTGPSARRPGRGRRGRRAPAVRAWCLVPPAASIAK